MKKKLLSLLSVSTVLVPFVAVSCGTTQEPKPVDPIATEVNVFKQTHATVLAKTESNVTAGDEASVNRALGDYNNLSAGAKGQLTTQKSNLDKLSAKITQLKAGQTKDKVGTGDPAPGPAPKPERPGETTGNQAVAALKTEIRTLLSELPSRNPRKLEVELALNSNNDQTNLASIKSELETLKNALNTAYAKLKTALETKLPTGNKFKTRVLNYVTTRSSDADEITELTNFETQLTQEETKLKEGIETLKSELGYFSSESQFRKEKEAEFAKALKDQTYFTDISQYSEKETEIRAKYVEENKSKVAEYFGEAPEDAKYQKNNLVKENDQMSAVKQWFVMGQKGGNLFRYLPGDFPPDSTEWLTSDNNTKNPGATTVNNRSKIKQQWSQNGDQKGQNKINGKTSAKVVLYAVEGDGLTPGKSNHNLRNNKHINIVQVHEPGVHESVRTLKEYEQQKAFLNKGGAEKNATGQKAGSMYEKVGQAFVHQWAWQIEANSRETGEPGNPEVSKVQLELQLSNNNLNMPVHLRRNRWWTWPESIIVRTSIDGITWQDVKNQSHKNTNDWLGANYGDQYKSLNQGQVNIPDWRQTGSDRWNTGAEFHRQLTNDTGKLVIEFEPVQAKYVQIEVIPKRNTKKPHSSTLTQDNWFVNGIHNNTNAPGSDEWKKAEKTTGLLDIPIYRVGFWGPSVDNPYKVAQKTQTAGGLTKTPGTILVEKKVKSETTSGTSTTGTTTTNPQTVEVNNGATVTIEDYDLTSWKVSDFWIKFRDEDKLTIISPKMAFNIKEVKKYYTKQEATQTSAVSTASSDSENPSTNIDPVAVELEIRPEDQPNNVFRVILGKVPKHDTFKGPEQKQVDSLNKDNKLLKYLLKIDIDRWEKVEVESHYKTEITNLFKVLKTKLEGKDSVVNTEHLKDWADLKNKILDYKVYPKPEVRAENTEQTTGGDSSTSSTGDTSTTQTPSAGGSSISSTEASSSSGTSTTTSS